MAQTSRVCPKCSGKMERGFVIDNAGGGWGEWRFGFVRHWAAGVPEKSFWTGTKRPRGKLVPIGTFRCLSCGFLEEYAKHEFDAR